MQDEKVCCDDCGRSLPKAEQEINRVAEELGPVVTLETVCTLCLNKRIGHLGQVLAARTKRRFRIS